MTRWAWIAAVVMISVLAGAQTSETLSTQESDTPQSSSRGKWHDPNAGERMFFPRDMFWDGHSSTWPHHKTRSIRTSAPGMPGDYGGVNAPCSLFARYMLSGVLEVCPFGRGPLRRFMVWGAPTFLFGKTIPKTLYTWSPDAIGIEHSWGVGMISTKASSSA